MKRPKDIFTTKYIVSCKYKEIEGYFRGIDIVNELAEATIYDSERDAEQVSFILKAVMIGVLPEFETKVVPYDVWSCAL